MSWAGFRKAYMRTFCYSIRDMNYGQMRAYALYGIQSLSSIKRVLKNIAFERTINIACRMFVIR